MFSSLHAIGWLPAETKPYLVLGSLYMSPSQMRMVDDLETMVRLFYRLSPGPSSVLDRALGKSTNIQDALSSLSGATAVLRARFPQF